MWALSFRLRARARAPVGVCLGLGQRLGLRLVVGAWGWIWFWWLGPGRGAGAWGWSGACVTPCTQSTPTTSIARPNLRGWVGGAAVCVRMIGRLGGVWVGCVYGVWEGVGVGGARGGRAIGWARAAFRGVAR